MYDRDRGSQAGADLDGTFDHEELNEYGTAQGSSRRWPGKRTRTETLGVTLPASVAESVAQITGRDVSQARVHVGPEAAAQAARLGARAFTFGRDIYLGAGERADDVQLLAHEATHVAQQQGAAAGVQLATASRVPRGDAAEAQADRVADAVIAGRLAPIGPLAPVPAGSLALAEPGAPAPAAAPPTPARTAGDVTSSRIIRVAWTVDDGPGGGTSPIQESLAGTPITWYVQRARLNKTPALWTGLVETVKKGDEIAIHGVHAENEHAAWFPPGHATIEEAMGNLGAFTQELRARGITARFVRLPGGLYTELQAHLQTLGYTGDENAAAKELITGTKGPDAYPEGDPRRTVAAALDHYRKALPQLGLAEWGGVTELQSWGAESSGMGGTDNATGEVNDDPRTTKRMEGLPPSFLRVFEQKCDHATVEQPEYLVLLTHDASQDRHGAPNDAETPKNAAEASLDDQAMSTYATAKKVRVEYYTMSQLEQLSAGSPNAPKGITPIR